MGNGAFFAKKKKPIVRRDPLTTAAQVLNNPEAKERLVNALKEYPPGIRSRWNEIHEETNHEIMPTEEVPDPLRIDLSLDEIKVACKSMYSGVKYVSSDGMGLLRDYIPKLYDKHSVDRGRRVSQRERKERKLVDECFAYGEIDHELFATIYMKVISVYGQRKEGVFYDLGCGVGQLVYAAAFIGEFTRVVGIEMIKALLDRGERRQSRWNLLRDNFTKQIKDMEFEFIEDDFILNGFWSEATFIFLHWTSFTKEQRNTVAKLMSSCVEGTHVISLTTPIPGNDFEVLISDTCDSSWGKVDFYFQEKMTPAVPRAGTAGGSNTVGEGRIVTRADE